MSSVSGSTRTQFSAEWYTSAGTTTTPHVVEIDWSRVFMNHEKELELKAKEELKKIKENRLRLDLKRKCLFTKHKKYY